MANEATKTIIYDLINAGHLARHAMLLPLADLGLLAGDDAIIFALSNESGASKENISQATGLENSALESRLNRLEKLGVVIQSELEENANANIILSKKGNDICDILNANWQQLDQALIGELSDSKRKNLSSTLNRFIKLLNL